MAGLADFMDRQVPAGFPSDVSFRGPFGGRGQPLAASGPNCLRIARAAAEPQFGEQMLAELFWWCYVRSEELAANLAGMGIGGPPAGHRQILVAHGDRTQYSLLILASGVRGPFVRHVTPVRSFYPQGAATSFSSLLLAERENMQAILTRAGIRVDERTIIVAVNELAGRADFRLVVAAPPDETPTAAPTSAKTAVPSFLAPSPALPVTIDGDPRPIATGGVIGADRGGRIVVTTARHAVQAAVANSARILVGGAPAIVTGSPSELTDSCLLAVACPAGRCVGHGGVLRSPPRLYTPATFAGAASGAKRTKITGHDPGIFSPTPFSGPRVYTDPDTIPGDSGAALVDADDHVAGFAVARTGIGAPFEYSSWSWADQVFTVHGLA